MKSDDEIQKSQKAKNRAKRIQVLPNTQKVGRFNPYFFVLLNDGADTLLLVRLEQKDM